MKWKKATYNKEDSTYDIPDGWLYMHYYEALSILFRFENSLRVFVYIILKNIYNEKWLDITIVSDDSQSGTINSISKKRLSQDRDFAYLGYSITSPLMFLTSGELIRLITDESYWKHFKKYFLGSKEIIKNKLDEIGNVRNSLAHFRPIKEDDLDLIKQNTKHVLTKIEQFIVDMLRCDEIVPSNTEHEWYKQFKILGTDISKLSFNHSKDKEWLRITLLYECNTVTRMKYSEKYIGFQSLNLISNAILKDFKNITKYITYLSEYQITSYMNKDNSAKFNKVLHFCFNTQVFSTNFEIIKNDFEKMLLKISEETELVLQDNLARGKLIEIVRSTARFKEGNFNYWEFQNHNFKVISTGEDPTEYWGDFHENSNDFVSNTSKFPWFQIKISEDTFPF